MKTVIVYAHPWDGSFNHHILEHTLELLNKTGDSIDVIDLNADGFDPVMRPSDLRVFGQGLYHDPLAEEYMLRLKSADNVVFIFPIWWYGFPAILKGFFDKVLLKGHTYGETEDGGLTGLLNIASGTVLTTGNINKDFLNHMGDPIQNTMIQGTLKMVGIDNVTWIHCPTVHLEDSRNEYLTIIDRHFSKK